MEAKILRKDVQLAKYPEYTEISECDNPLYSYYGSIGLALLEILVRAHSCPGYSFGLYKIIKKHIENIEDLINQKELTQEIQIFTQLLDLMNNPGHNRSQLFNWLNWYMVENRDSSVSSMISTIQLIIYKLCQSEDFKDEILITTSPLKQKTLEKIIKIVCENFPIHIKLITTEVKIYCRLGKNTFPLITICKAEGPGYALLYLNSIADFDKSQEENANILVEPFIETHTGVENHELSQQKPSSLQLNPGAHKIPNPLPDYSCIEEKESFIPPGPKAYGEQEKDQKTMSNDKLDSSFDIKIVSVSENNFYKEQSLMPSKDANIGQVNFPKSGPAQGPIPVFPFQQKPGDSNQSNIPVFPNNPMSSSNFPKTNPPQQENPNVKPIQIPQNPPIPQKAGTFFIPQSNHGPSFPIKPPQNFPVTNIPQQVIIPNSPKPKDSTGNIPALPSGMPIPFGIPPQSNMPNLPSIPSIPEMPSSNNPTPNQPFIPSSNNFMLNKPGIPKSNVPSIPIIPTSSNPISSIPLIPPNNNAMPNLPSIPSSQNIHVLGNFNQVPPGFPQGGNIHFNPGMPFVPMPRENANLTGSGIGQNDNNPSEEKKNDTSGIVQVPDNYYIHTSKTPLQPAPPFPMPGSQNLTSNTDGKNKILPPSGLGFPPEASNFPQPGAVIDQSPKTGISPLSPPEKPIFQLPVPLNISDPPSSPEKKPQQAFPFAPPSQFNNLQGKIPAVPAIPFSSPGPSIPLTNPNIGKPDPSAIPLIPKVQTPISNQPGQPKPFIPLVQKVPTPVSNQTGQTNPIIPKIDNLLVPKVQTPISIPPMLPMPPIPHGSGEKFLPQHQESKIIANKGPEPPAQTSNDIPLTSSNFPLPPSVAISKFPQIPKMPPGMPEFMKPQDQSKSDLFLKSSERNQEIPAQPNPHYNTVNLPSTGGIQKPQIPALPSNPFFNVGNISEKIPLIPPGNPIPTTSNLQEKVPQIPNMIPPGNPFPNTSNLQEKVPPIPNMIPPGSPFPTTNNLQEKVPPIPNMIPPGSPFPTKSNLPEKIPPIPPNMIPPGSQIPIKSNLPEKIPPIPPNMMPPGSANLEIPARNMPFPVPGTNFIPPNANKNFASQEPPKPPANPFPIPSKGSAFILPSSNNLPQIPPMPSHIKPQNSSIPAPFPEIPKSNPIQDIPKSESQPQVPIVPKPESSGPSVIEIPKTNNFPIIPNSGNPQVITNPNLPQSVPFVIPKPDNHYPQIPKLGFQIPTVPNTFLNNPMIGNNKVGDQVNMPVPPVPVPFSNLNLPKGAELPIVPSMPPPPGQIGKPPGSNLQPPPQGSRDFNASNRNPEFPNDNPHSRGPELPVPKQFPSTGNYQVPEFPKPPQGGINKPSLPEQVGRPKFDQNLVEIVKVMSEFILNEKKANQSLLETIGKIMDKDPELISIPSLKNISNMRSLRASVIIKGRVRCGTCRFEKDDDDFSIISCGEKCQCCSNCRIKDIKAGCPICAREYSNYEIETLEITKISFEYK